MQAEDLVSSEASYSSSESQSSEGDSWISWFCSIPGNEFLCKINREWIEDGFNLYGLRQIIGRSYDDALDVILDRLDPEPASDLNQVAAVLYGLIHARFILTIDGLELMESKFTRCGFGRCPRARCGMQPVLPIGMSDRRQEDTAKIYCPKCRQVYEPPILPGRVAIDGAFFGTSFPHLFLLTFQHHLPEPCGRTEFQSVPRIFGFRVHHTSPIAPGPFLQASQEQSEHHHHHHYHRHQSRDSRSTTGEPPPPPVNGVEAQQTQPPVLAETETQAGVQPPTKRPRTEGGGGLGVS